MTCGCGGSSQVSSSSSARSPVSLEAALLFLLYLSLLSDLILIARGRYSRLKGHHSGRKPPALRSAVWNSSNKSCGICQEKRSIHSLDNLWRRMQKATNQVRLVNLRHHMITKGMMEARMQARQKEREKLFQKKERLIMGDSKRQD